MRIARVAASVAIFVGMVFVSSSVDASSTVTATKNCTVTPCTVTEATFAISTAQVIAWSATWSGSGGAGNDFWLTTGASTTAEILLSDSLSGFNSGTHFLSPGTYRISIRTFLMGPGSYTIEFDRTASIGVGPTSSHTFPAIVAGGSASAAFSFTVSSTGDLPVTLSVGAPTDAAHFQIMSNPNGQQVPPSRTLSVRFVPGATPGIFNATITVNGTSVPPGTPVAPIMISVSGETLAPVPNITCGAANCAAGAILANADGDVGETDDFNVTFQNSGTAPLNITSITVVNDVGSAFSIVTPPSTAPVPAGGSRAVSVRFTPPAGEAIFCGHLVIHSNDPDQPTKTCFFRGRAHHPAPRMVLVSTVLDYGQVELGFSFHKAILVTNAGDATLNVNVTDVCTPDPVCAPSLPQWSTITTGPFTIPPGVSLPLEQTYQPTTIATHTIRLRVSGNDPTNPQQDVTLTGEGIAPIPIDSVLVLDRSGSMADSAGPRRKIDALQTAADLFVHLLRPDMGAGTGDKIGMVKYNESNQDYLALGFVNPTQVAAAEDALSNAAIADVGRLAPDGATGIGGAMQRGANMLLTPSTTRKHVMVLLTDGKENRDPRIGTVVGPINTNDPTVKIYSIGVGANIEPDKLQQISNVTNGYFQASGDLSGVSRFDLETFYFKIFSNATGMSIVVDPTTPVYISGTTPVNVASAWIVSSDRTATFLALDDPVLRAFYTIEFVDPNGHLIDTGSAVAGVPIQIMRRLNYSLYRVIFPDPALAHQYVGQWTLRVRPNGKWNVRDIERYRREWANKHWDFISPYSGLVPIAFAAAVGSDYRMDVSAVPNVLLPGADVTLKASFTDRHYPSRGHNVTVHARRPNGVETLVQLYDDGTHGDTDANDGTWTAHFTNTPESGFYRFRFHGVGINHRSELTPREETRYVSLTPPQRPGGGGDGTPCPDCRPCDPRRERDCRCFLCKEPAAAVRQ